MSGISKVLRITTGSLIASCLIGCGGGGGGSQEKANESAPNAKISNINANSSFKEGEDIAFLSNTSTDSDGSIVKYEWFENGTLLYTGETFRTSTLSVGNHNIVLKVTDNDGLSGTDSVALSVYSKTNQPPVAKAGANQSVQNGQIVVVDGSASYDPDGEIKKYQWFENNVLLHSGARFKTSTLKNGAHEIILTVTDDGGATSSDTVIVTVASSTSPTPPSNNAPVADSQNVELSKNETKQITLGASDSDGDSLTYTITTNPAYGTLSGTAPNLEYVPNYDYTGDDSFAFRVNDGNTDSNIAHVNIVIKEPLVQGSLSGTVSTEKRQSISIDLSNYMYKNFCSPMFANDEYTIVSQPANGSLVGTPPNIIYMPDMTTEFGGSLGSDFVGTDSFSFKVNWGCGGDTDRSSTITINVDEVYVNDKVERIWSDAVSYCNSHNASLPTRSELELINEKSLNNGTYWTSEDSGNQAYALSLWPLSMDLKPKNDAALAHCIRY